MTGNNYRFYFIKDTVRNLLRDKFVGAALVIVLLYFAAAACLEVYRFRCGRNNLTPAYDSGKIEERFQAPSVKHIMGTDYMGRDVFFRALAGSSTAVKVGVLASVISALIGVSLGVAAGYFGGAVDDFVVWIYSTFAAMPTLLFVLAFALLVSKGFLCPSLSAVFSRFAAALNTDPGMMAVYLGIGITGWVSLCQVVRGESMKLREAGYVQAAKVAGHNAVHIMVRHIIPNLFHLVIIYFTMRFAYAIMTEVIVSYLGLGVQMAPSWGVMIADGQERLWRGVWWEVAAATGFMFFLVLSLHILGDGLRDTLDPRLKN